MDIKEKILKAKEYVAKRTGKQDETELRNDAANIFADSYDEYMAIWEAVRKD